MNFVTHKIHKISYSNRCNFSVQFESSRAINSKNDISYSPGHCCCSNVTGLKDISEICLEKINKV